jgi:hypothetical protein
MRQTVAERTPAKEKLTVAVVVYGQQDPSLLALPTPCISVVLAHTLNPCVRASMIPWSRRSVTGRSRRRKLQIATARHGVTVAPTVN